MSGQSQLFADMPVISSPSHTNLIFLHIPKAGGSTLHRIIERQFTRNQCYTVDAARQSESIRRLNQLSPRRKSVLRMVKGHFPFGIHEGLDGVFEYFTLLRDPVSRIVSTYQYILREPIHYLYERVAGKMTLEGFVESGLTSELYDGQTRLLSGVGDTAARGRIDPVDEGIFDLALQNIERHFPIIGLVEHFDETLILLRRRYDWDDVRYVRRNVSRGQEGGLASEALAGRIRQLNPYDVRLFEFVQRQFQALLDTQDATYWQEVKELKSFDPGILWRIQERLRQRPRRIVEYAGVNARRMWRKYIHTRETSSDTASPSS